MDRKRGTEMRGREEQRGGTYRRDVEEE